MADNSNTVGFLRIEPPRNSEELWDSAWVEITEAEEYDERFLHAGVGDVLIGDTESVRAALEAQNPLPPSYRPLATEALLTRVHLQEPVQTYYGNAWSSGGRRALLVSHRVLGNRRDSGMLQEVVKACGPLVVAGGSHTAVDDLRDIREEFPPEDDLAVKRIYRPKHIFKYGGVRNNVADVHWYLVVHDVKAAKRAAAANRAVTSRMSLTADVLKRFVSSLFHDINRGGDFNYSEGLRVYEKAHLSSYVEDLRRALCWHAMLYGRYAYRRGYDYNSFMSVVKETEKATLHKFRDREGFCRWLRDELRSYARTKGSVAKRGLPPTRFRDGFTIYHRGSKSSKTHNGGVSAARIARELQEAELAEVEAARDILR